MMFKYNSSGEVTGLKIIDFQSLKFTTPVREFVTFIWASLKLEVRETKLDELYHLYCDSLNEYLEEFGCSEKLLFEDFKEEVKSFSPLVVLMACFFVPVCLADSPPDLGSLMTGEILNGAIKESKAYEIFQGEMFKRFYPQLLDQVAKEGVFDYLREKMDQTKLNA
uniref:CHK kinase-like domain-containing protein n=1 Tax=Graphocephala atropunctata TaxID=36148 RepID=A0A1B6MJM8_9HEMI